MTATTTTTTTTSTQDSALALLLPLLILLSSLLFLLLLFLIFLILLRRRRLSSSSSNHNSQHLRLLDNDGPLDLSLPDDHSQFEGGIDALERRWLESCTTATRNGYLRAKIYQTHHRPNSLPTDITLSQFLSIQEKGVSAWAFEPDYDSNPSLPILVQSRTEIIFLADGAGMSEEEGGGVSVQSNLPLPKLNEVYYFECKIYDKPEGTDVAIGLATKPYPSFRLPGWNRLSIGYSSADGFKTHNYPFTATSYGPPLKEGDILGVGYRPRTGTVFFTRNGKKLEDAYVGLNRYNLFPTIGSTGPGSIHVNLGQAGFVFIEANVKKWGLAPMAGTLAPPPAYGHQFGSILLDSNHTTNTTQSPSHSHHLSTVNPLPYNDHLHPESSSQETLRLGPSSRSTRQNRRRRQRLIGYTNIDTNTPDSLPHNPPTPRPLDISLEQLNNSSSSNVSQSSSSPSSSRIHIRRPQPESTESTEDEDHSDEEDDRRTHQLSLQEQQQQRLIERQRLSRDRQEEGGSNSHRRNGRSGSRSNPRPVTNQVLPPQYAPIDPYKYAAGVAEVMLSEQFQGSSHSFNSNHLTNLSNHNHHSNHHRT
ncbi:hypothetical protein Pst134EA_030333 [Puccinia striiformis f. sp. tritici]|uniref:hypothetical protein n=1 Tax=Puccinia striiformis f. sp. tritici TaxID=168172 RepID=UPI0020078119|nr:hypothetical protein Pst134EA_030333 [Puccinia striiformis f. sp. tritici]KAH9446414.1 hypothetical protein Pst134EA_030333 [Puccinia striiformis f. sp. tritici]KAI9599919.1 hypothetical protein KEM48_000027 [Puccinia striiformis f. sp. tritici PST-130]